MRDPEIAEMFGSQALTEKMMRFEVAWTEALLVAGQITQTQADAAMAALTTDMASGDILGGGSDQDGLPVPALIRDMRAGLPAEVQTAIHTGATSQDVLDTAMILTLLEVLQRFDGRLAELVAALDALKHRVEGAQIMGRTRMQAALPIAASQRVEAWRSPLAAHLSELVTLRNDLSVLQAGGAVGDRAFDPGKTGALLAALSSKLGLRAGPVWHSDRSGFVALGAWLTKVSGSCGKIGADIALMAQQGVDEIALRGGGGSSAMPHKQNPVHAETVTALARYVAAQNGLLGQAMLHEQERSGAAWALEWLTLPAMCEATGACLNSASRLVAQIERIGPAVSDG